MSNENINVVMEAIYAEFPNIGKTDMKSLLKLKGFSKDEINSVEIESNRSNQLDEFALMNKIIEMEAEGKSRKEMADELYHGDFCGEATARHILGLMKYVKAYYKIMSESDS